MTSLPELDSQSRFDAHRMGRGIGFHPIPGAASCRAPRGLQFGDPQQVVRRRRQVSGDLGFRLTDEACLSHSAHCLQPAEDLLDPLSFALADLVALGAGRSSIQARCLASVDPGNVRSDVVLAQMLEGGCNGSIRAYRSSSTRCPALKQTRP